MLNGASLTKVTELWIRPMNLSSFDSQFLRKFRKNDLNENMEIINDQNVVTRLTISICRL